MATQLRCCSCCWDQCPLPDYVFCYLSYYDLLGLKLKVEMSKWHIFRFNLPACKQIHCQRSPRQGGRQVCQCQGDFQSTIFWTKQSTGKDHADSTTVLLAQQHLVDREDHFVRGRRQLYERKSIQHESCTLWFLALHCASALDFTREPA